jgi:four helix bundle protein
MQAPYENLVAWRRADDLFIEVHQITHQRFPRFERFELGAQIRRAAYSVPANIVEGNARRHPRDSAHFLNLAAASLSEVGYGIHAALRLGYIDAATFRRLDLKVREAGAPLHGLIGRLRTGNRLLSQGLTGLIWLVLGVALV